MQLKVLEKVRLFFPGVFSIMMAVYYQLSFNAKNVFELIDSDFEVSLSSISFPSFLILMIGIFYYAYNIRNIPWKLVMKSVGNQINNALFSIAHRNPNKVKKETKETIRNTVYYHIIDHDNSLTEKSKIIKHNGAVLSCLIDTIIICILYLVIVVIVSIIKSQFIIGPFVLAIVFIVLSIPAVFIVLNKHKSLVNDQLVIIKTYHSEECKNKIIEILGNGTSDKH